MSLDQLPALTSLVLLLLAIFEFVRWLDKHGLIAWSGPKPKPRPTIYAWCIYRSGDDCTNPKSPVRGQECGLVRNGRARCKVREVKQQ
jgi:hypothetical protein